MPGLMACAALMACGTASNGPAGTSPSPSTPTSSSPVACSTSGPASSTWPSADKLPATAAITSVSVTGDTMTITFAQGTPAFEVATQPNANFTADPSGQAVSLAGKAGVKITLRGFRGDVQNYSGSKSITSTGPILLQASELGDFEGVVTWGAGLSAAGCAAVTASGSTLTFQFIRQPAA